MLGTSVSMLKRSGIVKSLVVVLVLGFAFVAQGCGNDAGNSGCGIACDDGNPCTEDACNLETRLCEFTPAANGAMCGSGEGVCVGGVCDDPNACLPSECDDDNDCTQDVCESAGMCMNLNRPDGFECDFGGDPGRCATGDCVDAGACATLVCDDDNDCTDDLCDPVEEMCDFPMSVDGTGCETQGKCMTGVCTVVDPDEQSAVADLACTLGVTATIDLTYRVDQDAEIGGTTGTANVTVEVDLQFSAAVLDVIEQASGATSADLTVADIDLVVAGGTPNIAPTLSVPQTLDLTSATDITLTAVGNAAVTGDGATTTDYTLAAVSFTLSSVGTLGDLVFDSAASECTLTVAPLSFD